MKPLIGLSSVVCLAPFTDAVPPIAPYRSEVNQRSELVAIVSVTNVSQRIVGKRENQTRQQRAEATVERVLKGTAPQKLVLAYDEPVSDISCQPPRLGSGRFLVFLRREGDVLVRTDAWYSQHSISTNYVNWHLGGAERLDSAVSEIERIVQSQREKR